MSFNIDSITSQAHDRVRRFRDEARAAPPRSGFRSGIAGIFRVIADRIRPDRDEPRPSLRGS